MVSAPKVVVVLFLVGCGFPSLVATDATTGSQDAGADASADAGTDVGPFVATTVQQVRDSATLDGSRVVLTNVVVTAVDTFGGRTGAVWVQQPGGGPSSGVQLFGLSLEQVQGLSFRDLINVTGFKDEYGYFQDTTGRTHTEIVGTDAEPLTIVNTGLQGTVTLEYLDATAIAALPQAERDAEHEKWEGAYVQVSLVRALAAPTVLGQTDTYRFKVPAFDVRSDLADFPSGIVAGACLPVVRGVVTYFFDYAILPASQGVSVGAGCP